MVHKMEIKELLERLVAQNETIIRQNVELLLVLSVLVERDAKSSTQLEQNVEVGSGSSSSGAA
jgi:hypothetical protein